MSEQEPKSRQINTKVSQEMAEIIDREAEKPRYGSRPEVVRDLLWSHFGEGDEFHEQPIDDRVQELHDEVSELSDTVDDLSLAVQDAGMLDERLRLIESRLAKLEEGGDA
jgi:Arc/MetJ-type ribon-helix-helix transcriptional regulator